MSKSGWITHRGRQILFVDLADFGQDLDGFRIEFEAALLGLLPQQSPGSVLALVDVRGTVLSRELTALMKTTAPQVKAFLHKGAVVVEFSGLKKFIIQSVSRVVGQPLTFFSDPEQAKDWLVQ